VQVAHAQCKSFIKKVDYSILDEYAYCGAVQSAMMNSSDSAEVEMKLSSKSKYRILIDAQAYLGEVQLSVVNSSDELVSIYVEESEKAYWEVFTDQKEKVAFKIKFQKPVSKQINNGIQAAGCVVLAVGKISLEELVEAPTGYSDL
jgi:hypothetical protein